jgi:hypothetical protein
LRPLFAFMACTGTLPFYIQLTGVLWRLHDDACPFAWLSTLTTVKWDRMIVEILNLFAAQRCNHTSNTEGMRKVWIAYFKLILNTHISYEFCGQTCCAVWFCQPNVKGDWPVKLLSELRLPLSLPLSRSGGPSALGQFNIIQFIFNEKCFWSWSEVYCVRRYTVFVPHTETEQARCGGEASHLRYWGVG